VERGGMDDVTKIGGGGFPSRWPSFQGGSKQGNKTRREKKASQHQQREKKGKEERREPRAVLQKFLRTEQKKKKEKAEKPMRNTFFEKAPARQEG